MLARGGSHVTESLGQELRGLFGLDRARRHPDVAASVEETLERGRAALGLDKHGLRRALARQRRSDSGCVGAREWHARDLRRPFVSQKGFG